MLHIDQNSNNPFYFYFQDLKASFQFRGRTTRKEYWMFTLASFIINLLITALTMVPAVMAVMLFASGGELSQLESGLNGNDADIAPWMVLVFFAAVVFFLLLSMVLVYLPMTSVLFRRLHDLGMSGWFSLLFLIPGPQTILWIVLGCIPGQSQSNTYGESCI